jgi:hypothetical protein
MNADMTLFSFWAKTGSSCKPDSEGSYDSLPDFHPRGLRLVVVSALRALYRPGGQIFIR